MSVERVGEHEVRGEVAALVNSLDFARKSFHAGEEIEGALEGEDGRGMAAEEESVGEAADAVVGLCGFPAGGFGSVFGGFEDGVEKVPAWLQSTGDGGCAAEVDCEGDEVLLRWMGVVDDSKEKMRFVTLENGLERLADRP